MNRTGQRISYVFLCAFPLLFLVIGGVHAFRIPVVHQVIGGVLFASTVAAAWVLGARVVASRTAARRTLALAGTLLVVPFTVMSLLWVGIGAPFQSTPTENYMRFLVLLTDSIVVSAAFVALKEELRDAGERFYATLGFAASIPAGAAYLVCMSLVVASYVARLRDGEPPSMSVLGDVFSVLEFVACVLTYVTTAAFAASMGQVGWLGRGATRAYVTISLLLLLLLMVRGLTYPEVSADAAPWYVRPGVIAGIPAIPWIMPFLLGVSLLRRIGDSTPTDGA